MEHLVQRKIREDCTPTDTARSLNKKGNLEDIERTDLDTKIDCGHCGEVQSFGSIFSKCGKQMPNIPDIHQEQVVSDTKDCLDQTLHLKDTSWRPSGTAASRRSKILLAEQKNHHDRAVRT